MTTFGRSLHIGVNELDRTHYQGQFDTLRGAENDAWLMAGIARQRRFSSIRVLLGKQATADAVLDEICAAADELREGSMFLLTFAGHGIQEKNRDDFPVESEAYDQEWCTYDRPLLDDELRLKCLPRFAEGTRVVIVVDACHSATPFEAMRGESRGVQRTIGFEASRATHEHNKDLFDRIRNGYAGIPREPLRAASVVSFGACRDDQSTEDGVVNGAFTTVIDQVWQGGAFSGTYGEFWKAVKSLVPPPAEPSYCCYHTVSSTFWNEPAFVI